MGTMAMQGHHGDGWVCCSLFIMDVLFMRLTASTGIHDVTSIKVLSRVLGGLPRSWGLSMS
jgi:hypothetical protein